MSSCRHTPPLLSLLRHGDVDERVDRHVAHLEFCRACQRALIDDRALARQVERALRERVADVAPSPAAWLAVERRIAATPAPWHARLTRWLRVPAGGLASAGALSAIAVVLTVSGGPVSAPAADESAAHAAAGRTMLPIRSTPLAEMARVPAEPFDAPTPPDLNGVVMEAQYARPAKDPKLDVVFAALLGKAPLPDLQSAPDGYELVAYHPADAE